MCRLISLVIVSAVFLFSAGVNPSGHINSLTSIASASTAKPFAGTVKLDSASFTPSTIGSRDQATNLNVVIATSFDTSEASMTVTVIELTNFNGVEYTISNSNGTIPRIQRVNLTGGQKTTVTFKFRTTSNNSKGGQIISQVILSDVTNATLGDPAEISNLTLTVNDPVAVRDTRAEQQICRID